MKRIAHISLHGDPLEPLGSIEAGGQNVYVKNVASQIARQGVEVDCFTRWSSPEKRRIENVAAGARCIRLKGGPVEYVKKENTLKYVPQMLSDFQSFMRENGVRYDLIHTHYYVEGQFGLAASRILQLPQVHTFHSLGRVKLNHERMQGTPNISDYAHRTGIERQILEEADLIIATSPYEAEDFREWYGHNNANVCVVPCGLDPRVFYPRNKSEMRSELGLPDNRCILLYAGRLDERKGIETLLFAYYKLLCDMRRTGQELLLVIVGGNRDPKAKDPQFTHFRQLAKSLQLSEYRRSSDSGCIRFVGSQDQENIAKYYSAADMTVVPSYYEPFGMVAIETQACGTPAVASAVGGLRYALENETGGLLAKPYSPESLCEKLTQLVCNPGLRRELASAGYERVMRKFTWESVASQLLVEYNRMQQVRDRAIEMIRPTQRPARIFKPVALPNQPRTRIPGKSFSQNKSGI